MRTVRRIVVPVVAVATEKIVNALQHKEKRMFRTVLTRLLLVPLAIVLAATGSTAAHASTPMTASGTFTYTYTPRPSPMSGPPEATRSRT
jgi:uncharacterized membrane protein YoaK (UPF0700 family)